jgi:hypothetical protein
MPGASGEFGLPLKPEEYEGPSFAQLMPSSLGRAISNWAARIGKPLDPGDVQPTMDPDMRDLAMNFGPGALPAVAGISKSFYANSIRKELLKNYPASAVQRYTKQAMDFIREVPQNVMDRIERFAVTGKEPVKSYGRGGEERVKAGGYLPGGRHFDTKTFAPKSIRDEFFDAMRGVKKVRGSKEPARPGTTAMPEIEIQGLNLEGTGRTAANVTRTGTHEVIHAIEAEVRRKLGHVAAENMLSHGVQMAPEKAALYGRREGISYWGAKNPDEFLDYIGDYFKALQQKDLPTRLLRDWETGPGSMLDKAIRRNQARVKKGKQND